MISKVFHSPAGLTRESRLLLREVDPLELAVDLGLAEEVAAGGVAGLGLVPDPGVGRVAGVDARVVALLARDRREPPLDVEDAVADLLVPAEPLVAAVALADEMTGRRVERPLRAGIELARRRDRPAGPALELGPGLGQEVRPALGVALQGAGRLGLIRQGRRRGQPQYDVRDPRPVTMPAECRAEFRERKTHGQTPISGRWSEVRGSGSPGRVARPAIRPRPGTVRNARLSLETATPGPSANGPSDDSREENLSTKYTKLTK